MIAWLHFMSILIRIIIPSYLIKGNFATLCYVYSHYRYQRTCDAIPPNAPSQVVGHWSAIILHTAHVFITPTPGVPFKIPVPPTARPVIIEYSLAVRTHADFIVLPH